MSTRRKPPSRSPLAVSSTGLKIEVRHKARAPLPTALPGEHLWTVVGMWTVRDPTADRLELDVENLVTIDGPGCFICERPYADAVTGPCPGEPPLWGPR